MDEPIQQAARPARRTRRWRRWVAVPVALAAALGLGLALQPAHQAQGTPPTPDFTLPAAANARGTLALHALRGHAVLLNFFNTQCQPCIEEMPTLRRTARVYRARGVMVLGVATGGDTVATARVFARDQHLPYPVVADTHQDIAWRYAVSGWPTTFFLDARGRLRGMYNGPLDRQSVRDGLAQAGALRCAACARVAAPPSLTVVTPASSASTLNADTLFTPPRPAPPFSVRDQQGRLITPRALRGQVVALTFVSSICQAQCPLIGKTLAQVRRDLGAAARHLSIVAISAAPERDTPRTIRHFAAAAGWRGADWHYLTAPRRVLAPIWRAYGVYVGPAPQPGQDPDHYASLYLIDPRGKLRAYYDAPFLAPRVAASIRALLDTRNARGTLPSFR